MKPGRPSPAAPAVAAGQDTSSEPPSDSAMPLNDDQLSIPLRQLAVTRIQ